MINYYAIKCKSLKVFNRPFIAADDKEAMILVRNVLYSENGAELQHNATDYSVYHVGGFNNERGTFNGRARFVFDVDSIPVVKRKVKEEATDEVQKETNPSV